VTQLFPARFAILARAAFELPHMAQLFPARGARARLARCLSCRPRRAMAKPGPMRTRFSWDGQPQRLALSCQLIFAALASAS
jgi:hypothetical protein